MPFMRNRPAKMPPAAAAGAAANGEIVLVDVREDDERRACRPAGSLHIPLGELPARLDELPTDRTVAFVCRSGGRSAMAARAAADRGLTVADVRGGLTAWQAAGLPVETGPASAVPNRKAR